LNITELLKQILNIGKEMLRCGAEVSRVEDSLYRICGSYNLVNCDIWVISSNIQATVETARGETLTEICYIKDNTINYDRLDRLNYLSRYICANMPEPKQIKNMLTEILSCPSIPPWREYVAGILAGVGFGVFFGCDWLDAIVTAIAAFLLTWLGRRLRSHENNPLVYNFILSFLLELLILFSVHIGFGHHSAYITIGMVMLLISALGTANGICDLLHRDTLSGILNISNSFIGAAGIALGITLAMLVLRSSQVAEITNSTPWIQTLSCTVGCVGFALTFQLKGMKIFWAGLGAFLTWNVYIVAVFAGMSTLESVIVSAAFVAMYAQIMARISKTPSTVFLTTCVFPIIPGPSLYYMMHFIVWNNFSAAQNMAITLLLSCLGIALGFIFVDIAYKYLILAISALKQHG
jgi:uncharacterized membrane protein YjjP (DUF1212 family)